MEIRILLIDLHITFFTGDFFDEWNEITPQTHIRKIEEQTA